MAEHRRGTKGRRMGSSRRRQLREGSGEASTAAPGEEPLRASGIVRTVQDFFREQDKDQAGFVTRSDMKKLQEENFPCSMEELELVFDGLDAAGTGRLRTEEFSAGLCQFLSSQKAARDHRRRKTTSRRVRLVFPSTTMEGADSEEQRRFAAFMEQLGTDNISEEKEIWQLWVKLRQEEPQLLGNLEDFLAKMRHRIQETRSKKEALELTLNKCIAEHDKEVQQLCEALEQQIRQEKQRLEQESMARSHQHGVELQRALDASEREVQRLVTAQMELETRCRSLRGVQQATSTENQQLEENNRELENRLQHLHQQLQQTRGHLQTARAAVAWEHVEELRDRAVAELPEETPVSPQMSPTKSEKYRSEMRIRLGSQGGEPKAKSTHQVVWEMPLAVSSRLGAMPRASSTEDDPFPEFLKEERFSDQSALLREMNDAITALSKQLKTEAPGAALVPADAAPHRCGDDDEPQTGLGAATAFGPTPGVLQKVLLGHITPELFEGDLKEGPARAQLGAPDMPRAGASAGAEHHRGQESGAEQGQSPEEAWRTLFLQGEGASVEKLVLKAAEHPQRAPGESVEAGEMTEMKGVGWMQERTGWEKARLLGGVEEVALSQGENSEAGLGPLEARKAGLAAGWHLVTGELGPAVAREERAKPQSTGLGKEADPPSGHSKKLEMKPGEHPEPEPPTWGQAGTGAAQGDGALAKVTVDPGPRTLEEEHIGAEVQPWAETLDAIVPPAQHRGSSTAGAEDGKVEVTQPMEAEPQAQGEFAMGDAEWGGSVGAEALSVPPTDVQEGGMGTEEQLLEAQSCDVNVRLLAEVEAALQPPSQPGGNGAPEVQPLEEDDKAELGLGEERGAAAVPGEGPSRAETPAGWVGGLLPVNAQALELVGTEESWAHMHLCEDPSPDAPLGGRIHAAIQREDEGEGEGRRQGEQELPHEPLMDLHAAGFGRGDGAGAEEQPGAEADKRSAGRGDPAPLPAVSFRGQTAGVEEDGDVCYPEEEWELELVQGEGINKNRLFLVKAQTLELEKAEASCVAQLCWGVSPETPRGEESGAAVQLAEEAEKRAQGQGERELPQELDPQGAGVGQGEGDAAGVQPQDGAAIPDSQEDQSCDANMQLLAEAVELKLTPGGSTEEDLQPLSEGGYLDREQRRTMAADMQLQGQMDKADLVKIVKAEDLHHAGMQLLGGHSTETLQEWGDCAAAHLVEESEEGEQGQGEREPPQELVLHPHGVAIRQGGGTPEDVQPWQAGILDSQEDRSTDANMQLLAEAVELKLTPGRSTEENPQLLSEAGSLDTEQRGSVAADVQLQDQAEKPELMEMETEDAQADTRLCGYLSPESPRAEESGAEEAEEAQGQGERELPQELNPQGAGVGQGEGDAAGVQPQDGAVILDSHEDQSCDANMQLLAEAVELKLTPGGSTEEDLQSLSEAGYLGTEQGGNVAADAQPLERVDELELMEMETEDARADTRLCGYLSPESPRGEESEAAMQLAEEAEEEEQGQDECELPCELDPQGVGVRQGKGAGVGVQPWEEAVILGMLEDQSSDANMQLLAEAVELKLTPGRSTEENPQPLSEAGSLDTEQGGNVAADVQLQDQAEKPELMEMETEDARADTRLCRDLSPETPRGEESGAAVQLTEEAEDGAQGQDECELPRELDPQGAGVGQGEGDAAGVQPQDGAAIPDSQEDQISDANMQLLAEAVELKLAPGGSTEEDLQPLSEVGYPGTEQGGSVAADAQPLERVDEPELVELVEAEDLQADRQLCRGLSPETLHKGVGGAAIELKEEAEDGAQGQDKHGTPQEPVLHPHGMAIRQGEEAPQGVQPWDDAESLDTLEDRSTDANVQPLVDANDLKMTQGWGTEADLQPLSKAGSLDTGQGGSMAPDVQLQGQVDKPELVELVEAEDFWADTKLHGVSSPEILAGWGNHAAVHHLEETQDGAEGQGEWELLHQPVLDLQGAGVRQGEGGSADAQPQEEAVILDTPADQSSDADVQPLSVVYELQTAPREGMEADVGTLSKAGPMGTEQGETVAPDVLPLDQIHEPELVEVEAEDSWVATQLRGGLSPETLQGLGRPAAAELVEEAENGVEGQGECELPQEPVLDAQGTRAGQGDGTGAGVQPWEEAVIPDTLENQSSDANMQPLREVEELKPTLGGSTEADLSTLTAVGMQKGEQSQTPSSEAGLCAAHTADALEGAAGAPMSSPAEAASYPECAAAPEGPGLATKLGPLTGPDGQILGETQTLGLHQRERAAAERRPLDGAQGLEVVQGERLEARVRSFLETQGLGLKQGHDDTAPALTRPDSEMPPQISTLKLETMMQEDVLVPDAWRLGSSGQAAQSELQEQVSAKADKVRLGIASQQPEEKPPHVMETEQVTVRPAEPPKQEVPPASTLHTVVQQEEGAGNDQLRMVLGDSSLGDAANSSTQPQRQLLGGERKDLSAGQQEKKQEVGQKMSQEGKASPGDATADRAGPAPRGSPEASPEPDHLYNVLFVGDSHVGKTSFLYRLHADTFNPHLTATVGLDYQVKNLIVDNKHFALRLWDSAGQERYHSITKQFFRKADGVVLMYDITSEYSFSDVRYWLSCIQEGAEDGVAILLLGNKTDCAAERRVPKKEGERLAKEHQLLFYECSAASGHNVSESMVSLIRMLKVHEDELKKKAEEVPKPPQKKKGCCW